jgi:hypothetical protein
MSESPVQKNGPAASRNAVGSASATPAVEIEAGIVDLESTLVLQPPCHRRDIRLLDLLHAPATRAGQMVVMGGLAGDIGVHVAIALQSSCDPGVDEPLEGSEHGRPADRWLIGSQPPIQLLGSELAPCRREVVGDEDALSRDPLARGGEAAGGVQGCAIRHRMDSIPILSII